MTLQQQRCKHCRHVGARCLCGAGPGWHEVGLGWWIWLGADGEELAHVWSCKDRRGGVEFGVTTSRAGPATQAEYDVCRTFNGAKQKAASLVEAEAAANLAMLARIGGAQP